MCFCFCVLPLCLLLLALLHTSTQQCTSTRVSTDSYTSAYITGHQYFTPIHVRFMSVILFVFLTVPHSLSCKPCRSQTRMNPHQTMSVADSVLHHACICRGRELGPNEGLDIDAISAWNVIRKRISLDFHMETQHPDHPWIPVSMAMIRDMNEKRKLAHILEADAGGSAAWPSVRLSYCSSHIDR